MLQFERHLTRSLTLMTGAVAARAGLCRELAVSMIWAWGEEVGEWGKGMMFHLAISATRFLGCAFFS